MGEYGGRLMALFMILCTDKAGSRELRAATRDAHLAYLASQTALVKLGGPWLDDNDGGPLGSLLLVEAEDITAARAFAAADPYSQAGLFSEVAVRPWRLVIDGFSNTP